ncbi:MAG: type II secretion system F family protein [Deltaproteobacteria bacterium]|nr:type II secretion system F family protein [Deltaproteobacteria bacterium]
MANYVLSERGLIPSRVTLAGKKGLGFSMEGLLEWLTVIKTQDLILFTKQLKTMIKAGVPLLTLFRVLEDQTENLKLKKIVERMTQSVTEGNSLYETFNKFPKAFSPLYCSMLRAGESSGSLPGVLDRLIYIIQHDFKLKSDIKAAFRYPIFVVVFLSFAFLVLLTYVVPQFAAVFAGAKLTLPLPTRICISLNLFLTNHWFELLIAALALVAGVIFYLRTSQGGYVRDRLLLKIPVLGPLFIKGAMSRFASIFSILQTSGVSVLESMDILAGTIGNKAIAPEFVRIRQELEEGKGIAGPLREAKYFTPMIINMVAVGELSGNLDEMLQEASSHYDDEVEYATARLTETIGPLLIIGLAGVVGFFALSIFLPMWDLTKVATRM